MILTWSWTQAEQEAATPHLATGTARISSLIIDTIISIGLIFIFMMMIFVHRFCHQSSLTIFKVFNAIDYLILTIVTIILTIVTYLAMTRSLRCDPSSFEPALELNWRPSTGFPNFKTLIWFEHEHGRHYHHHHNHHRKKLKDL